MQGPSDRSGHWKWRGAYPQRGTQLVGLHPRHLRRQAVAASLRLEVHVACSTSKTAQRLFYAARGDVYIFLTRNHVAHTCDGHGHAAKSAGGIVQVQPVLLDDQIEVCISDVVSSIPKVEVRPSAAAPHLPQAQGTHR